MKAPFEIGLEYPPMRFTDYVCRPGPHTSINIQAIVPLFFYRLNISIQNLSHCDLRIFQKRLPWLFILFIGMNFRSAYKL